jgi:heme-degrading monooxygenase HmoA
MQKQIHRITYLKVKEGKEEQFDITSKTYQNLVLAQEGLIYSKMFKSFFSFPQKKARNAHVLLQTWKSEQHANTAELALKQNEHLRHYFEIITLETDYFMQAEKNAEVNFEKLIGKGFAIEFATRQVKKSKEKAYPTMRNKFMKFVKEQPGFVFDQEFKSTKDNMDILVFGWQSVGDFERAGKKVKSSLVQLFKTLHYFTFIKQKAFQVGT